VVIRHPGRVIKKRSVSRLRRATLRRRRRQRETRTTEDILQLAKNSPMYSPLLNNYTVDDSDLWLGNGSNGSSNMHNLYEAAVVYDKTELVITNLRHFQEYSIEVCVYNKNNYNSKSMTVLWFNSRTYSQQFPKLKGLYGLHLWTYSFLELISKRWLLWQNLEVFVASSYNVNALEMSLAVSWGW